MTVSGNLMTTKRLANGKISFWDWEKETQLVQPLSGSHDLVSGQYSYELPLWGNTWLKPQIPEAYSRIRGTVVNPANSRKGSMENPTEVVSRTLTWSWSSNLL